MSCKWVVVLLTLCLLSQRANAQQPSMSANAGLGPGNSFTLFVTFENPMPKVQGIGCAFQLLGSPKPGQEDFEKTLRCSGAPIKDDDTHYRIKVGDFPQDIADGDYRVVWISVSLDGETAHQYDEAQLPKLAPVSVSNPKKLEFSPIKKLDVKP